MFSELNAFFERPEPFSAYTIDALWTDPHRAKGMLACHLDPETELASRRPERIAAIVDWLDLRLGFARKAITDLGCGPGLYAEAMARRGGHVTGLDFSAHSLAHARTHAGVEALSIAYRQADYLKDPLPDRQDVVMLIYGDLCPLSPDRRRRLYDKVSNSLMPGGTFVFDVFSTSVFARLGEKQSIEHSAGSGFWATGAHTLISKTFLYPDQRIGLDRYLVVSATGTEEIYNWMQYFDQEAICAELTEAGFGAVTCHALDTGGPVDATDEAFMVLARR
ncbi:MAG: methyltransferase domain-containing protein [Alphaproteobacteria bacterium]|nr:methyltransferase domain-containing protein [Alphaproteobacteria bacterium]